MKHLNLILSIFIVVLLSACGGESQDNSKSDNKSQNIDSTKTAVNENKTDVSPGDSYMTFSSDEQVGNQICIEVQYPKDKTVWIDWNDNKKLDEGEKLDSVRSRWSPDDIYYIGFYEIEKKVTLKNSKFTIYGDVTYLFCPESKISKIDISNNPHLEELFCHDNNITSLDISKNKNLEVLFCRNTELTDLDISKNSKLSDLTLPKTIKSKIFDFTPQEKKVSKQLEQQNLIPKGYHVSGLAENENDNKSKEYGDKLIFIEPDIPYAARKDGAVVVYAKLMYFKNIGNNKYKMIGEADSLFSEEYFVFENENKIIQQIWLSEDEIKEEFYIVKNGKIINEKTLIKPNAEGIYEVTNAEELLGSIASNRTIKIMTKKIDLTKTKLYYSEVGWNTCEYEILGLVLSDIKNLTIIGGLDERTDLLIDVPSNTVLTFSSSENIKLQNLRIGHTNQAGCYGGVLAFISCKKITLDNVLLYGCGTHGITTCGTEQLSCTNSIIEDCSTNALDLNKCTNSVFENFHFKDNEIYGVSLIKATNSQNITFKNGKINNNGMNGNDFIVEVDKNCKSITFENVEIKDNKIKETTNNTDESVVKFTK